MVDTVPRIALVSGLAAAAPPAQEAIQETFGNVEVWNILDDRLIEDTTELGGVDARLEARMTRLLDHAAVGGSAGILITCSLYGFMAPDASQRLGIPVLGPDDAMFDLAQSLTVSRVAVVSGVPAALSDSTSRAAHALGSGVSVVPVFAEAARAPSLRGDFPATADALALALASSPPVDAVMLANYSLNGAAALLERRLNGTPVLSGPVASAARLRFLVDE